jgi:hypothetical protein
MGRCWKGYKPAPGKKPYEKGSCIEKSDIDPNSQYVKINGKHGWHKIVDIKDTGIPAHKPGGGNIYTVESHAGQTHDVHQSKVTSHAFGSDIVDLNKSIDLVFYDNDSIDAIIPNDISVEIENQLVKHLEKLGYVEILDKGLKAEHKSAKGGMTSAGVTAYRRENPGSKLQTAVTEKNPEGSRAKRRRSFCSRMSGVEGPMKDDKGRPTRKALALKRWRC